jgi:hypothetical protein
LDERGADGEIPPFVDYVCWSMARTVVAVTVNCNECDALLAEEFSTEPSRPCPVCGSLARRFHVEIAETCQIDDLLGVEGREAGLSRSKGWFIRSYTRLVPQMSRGGTLAYVKRIFDRRADRYVETVTIHETGEIIHHCDEPLSKHQGHGLPRRKK